MRSFLFLPLFFTGSVSFAQDTITKRNSEKIVAKILEIGLEEIKYKKFDFQDGPLYIEKKSAIKSIVYANGVKETFEEVKEVKSVVNIQNKDDYYGAKSETNHMEMWNANSYHQKNRFLNEREMHTIMLQTKDKKLMALVGGARDAKAMQYVGFAGIPLGIAAYGLLYGSLINGTGGGYLGVRPNAAFLTGSAVCVVAAIACPIVSGSFKKKRKAYDNAAVKLYNEKF